MATQAQHALTLAPPTEVVQPTHMSILQMAVAKGADIATIERLVALQQHMLDREAEVQFNEALARVQAKIKRVAPDLDNNQTKSKYASYAAIDRVIRPVYSEEGFSLSFSEDDCPKAEHVRIVCFVSKGSHTRTYRKDMPADGKGAKGGDVMTKTHAAAAADSYAKRYLVKDIFNIAIGEDDTDGNTVPEWLEDHLSAIEGAADEDELYRAFKAAYQAASSAKDKRAQDVVIKAKDSRRKALSCK